ncbi:hypothetical protein Ddye_017151 [Dipteronia dyeriana]|uniref:RNase H type-1 domain-containing protein n=1 Tax=Dipteronia dyeriana TaxID=168575 RepID=A0AAD9U900_9ROSI|nr:hypothetical protein Ddye_017151 [Dipteronia dyeriana]
MSVFKIPLGITHKIEKLQRSFLWGDGLVKKKLHAINWEVVCRSKMKGCLGIGKVAVKNQGESLWKRVIVARYGLDDLRLYWNWKGTNHPSFFTKAIAIMYNENSRSTQVLQEGSKVIIGEGNRASFWEDIRVEESALKVFFPRIFALATKKVGVVCSESGRIRRGISDVLVWTVNSKGFFSVNSFCRRIEGECHDIDEIGKFIWKGISPPKFETFVWQLLKERVMVRQDFRNQKVFKGKKADFSVAIDTIKFRTAFWFKFHDRGVKDSITAIMLNIPDLCIDPRRSRKRKVEEWIPPVSEGLKFNVDGSSRGNPRPAGISGVLRDSRGKIICLFSLYMGIFDSNLMELLAIEKACSLCDKSSSF